MRDLLGDRAGMLYDILRYHLGWVDERGNPAPGAATPLHAYAFMTLSVADAMRGDFTGAVSAAAAVEMVYNFVLVHGDVQAGRVDQRSDRPSIWWVWGPSQAINAGDGLHALARSLLMRLRDVGIPAEDVLEALRSLDQACLILCEGQYMDLSYQDQLMVSESDYFDMIARKSGSIAGCAAQLGAMAVGVDGETAAAAKLWGTNLGMALQIRQDIADLWGHSGDGFTASNVLNKKKSLPLIHGLESTATSVKRELGGIYMKRVLEASDARRIVEILDDAGSRAYAESKAAELVEEAGSNLRSAAAGMARPEAMRQAADWVMAGGLDAVS